MAFIIPLEPPTHLRGLKLTLIYDDHFQGQPAGASMEVERVPIVPGQEEAGKATVKAAPNLAEVEG